VMSNRALKISLAWVVFSAAMFFEGWIGGKRSAFRIADSPRFLAPHQKVSRNEAFNVGVECPPEYDMKFIALTPNEEKKFEQKPGDALDEVAKQEKRTNELLNNAVCVKRAP
jgi:hypothetical protein